MKHIRYYLLAAFVMSAMMWTEAHAQIGYGLLVGSGSRMTGSFTDLQYGSQAGAGQTIGLNAPSSDLISIGFTFNFDGTDYTELAVSSNGFLSLGGSYGSPGSNGLASPGSDIIAPFWDSHRVPGGFNDCGIPGQVQYMVTGSAPNRILVVDWQDISLTDGYTPWAFAQVTFQVRLYEGSNKIEFQYAEMNAARPGCETSGATSASTTGSIGITSSNGYISVTPAGSNASSSMATANNSVNLSSTVIDDGVLYTFCPAGVEGNVAEGGTADMADGDALLVDQEVVLSGSKDFKPFTLFSPCAATYTYSISGPAAGEYSISPASGALSATGNTPTLTFSPSTLGVRQATLSVRDALGFIVRNYELAGEGIPRITWIGNIAEGGTPNVADGDSLMLNIAVDNGTSEDFTPLTLSVAAGVGPDAPITYTLVDPTGQFSIDRASDLAPMGTAVSPVITFTPTGIGPQQASLTVNAEGEIRNYILRPFARGAGARFFIGTDELGPGSPVFQNMVACVGEEVRSVEIRIQSIGDLPFELQSSDAYLTDNVIKQGTPPFELLRDQFGNTIPAPDYFISDQPNSAVPLQLPVVVNPGESRNIYLNFLPIRPEKRRARAFFETNGLNFFGLDTDNNSIAGILNFELVGEGRGSKLTGVGSDLPPKSLVFPKTEVRSTSTLVGFIRNDGFCDLRVDSRTFGLVSGDVSEFEITEGLTSPMDAQGNFVIPPGGIDSFAVRFRPERSGSRRASIRMETNDSTVLIEGVTERGTHYMDVFGIGKVGIEGRKVTLAPAVIDGPSSRGVALLENTSSELITITGASILDTTNEVMEDPSNPWPSFPITVEPGEMIDLGLIFTPESDGDPGMRNINVEVTLSNGDVVVVSVQALAGTRRLMVIPGSLFVGTQIPAGSVTRQFVIVTNSGTLPVTVQELKLTMDNPGDYEASGLDRAMLQPGQIEFYEVTYSPQALGTSNGILEIVSNATNGPHEVTLGGEGTSTSPVVRTEGASTITVNEGDVFVRPEHPAAGATLLRAIAPNPVSESANVGFVLSATGDIAVGLYDAAGRLVKSIARDEFTAGSHSIRFDLEGVSAGQYFVRMVAGGSVLTQPLTVVR